MELVGRLSPVLVSDETRREEIIEVLGRAAADDATSQLMISPLQVTLLFQLVMTHNNIPKDRWTLFLRHYETLRDREIAKGGITGQVIGLYKSQIDKIHYDAGYLLHLRAETSGRAQSFFTVEEFTALTRSQLERDGFEDDLDDLTARIVKIATDRLVFLGCRTDGQVSFDVRSLQEFMAAARLTTSPEICIQPRLYEIAGRAHWLHVFKIACSKIFSSASHEELRETIISLLDCLDAGDRDPDDRLIKNGASLAQQLLTDGLATAVPAYRRKLVVRSLKLLSGFDYLVAWRLAPLVEPSLWGVVEPILAESVSTGNARTKLQVFQLLAFVCRNSNATLCEWGTRLLLKWWPSDPPTVLAIFDNPELLPENGPILDRLREAQWQLKPEVVREWLGQFEDPEPSFEPLVENASVYLPALARSRITLTRTNGKPSGIAFTYLSLAGKPTLRQVPTQAQSGWHVLSAALTFLTAPSALSLGLFLRRVAELDALEDAKELELCWILKAMVHRSKDKSRLIAHASEAEASIYGDTKAWVEAEHHWSEMGLKQNELSAEYYDMDLSPKERSIFTPVITASDLIRTHEERFKQTLTLNELLCFVNRQSSSAAAWRILLTYALRAGEKKLGRRFCECIANIPPR